MDDQNKQYDNQNVTATSSDDSNVQTVSQQTVPPAAPTPVTPPPAPHKELEPVVAPDVSFEAPQEAIAFSEQELKIENELTEAGVEAAVEKPFLTKEHKIVGLEHAKESVAIPTQPSVKLPMTQEEAEKIVKFHKKFTDSVVWLATLVLFQIKRMHAKITES